jgi:hypothetical protein
VHACVTVLLKPHCGLSGTPFMKTATLFSATSLAICARARGRLTCTCHLRDRRRATHLCVDVAIGSGVGLDLGLEVVVHAQRTGGQPRERGARKHRGAQGCLAEHHHGDRGVCAAGGQLSGRSGRADECFGELLCYWV